MHYLIIILKLLLFSPQSDSEKVTSSSTESSSCDMPTQEINDDEIHQFMYIQMEFCEKSTLRYYKLIII